MSGAFTHDRATDRELRLVDGRRMTWSEFGAPAGTPVLSCHGGLLCRFDVEPCSADLAAAGLRVLSPDRPGVGGSDRAPGHSTADWVDDARQLLDALGLERVAVVGWSLGGQYAAAVAARLGERVSAAAIVAGCPPLDDHDRFVELNTTDRRGAALAAVGAARSRRLLDRRPSRSSLAAAAGPLRGEALAAERRRGHRRSPPRGTGVT